MEKTAAEEAISQFEIIVDLYDEQFSDRGMTNVERRELNRDLRAALVDRTTGEAASKLDASGQGQGVWAYLKLRRWFRAATGMAKMERRSKLDRRSKPINQIKANQLR